MGHFTGGFHNQKKNKKLYVGTFLSKSKIFHQYIVKHNVIYKQKNKNKNNFITVIWTKITYIILLIKSKKKIQLKYTYIF